MKRNIVTYILIALFAFVSNAQGIDAATIKSFVTQSPEEYKNLADRFVQADSTLTVDELTKVYYGAPFYKDFTFGKYDTQLAELYDNAESAAEFDVVYLVAQKALNENPTSFDLTVKAIGGACNGTDQSAQAQLENLRTRYANIYTVISFSGNGIQPEDPIYVTSQSDMLKYLAHCYGAVEILGESAIMDCKAIKVNRIDGDNMKEAIIYVKIIN